MGDYVKILACGDVRGKFKTLFNRVQSVNEKNGPFECLLCVGDFFGPSNTQWVLVKNGTIKAPIPIYILGPNIEMHERFYGTEGDNELAENINYLGKRGVFNLSGGLKLVYVSGTASSKSESMKITEADVISVRDFCIKSNCHFRGADILITSEWPQGICAFAETMPENPPGGSHLLSWLAAHIKPRYHFSGLHGIHYEREPYRNAVKSGEPKAHLTRFIGLAEVGNAEKRKWIYAFQVAPLEQMKEFDLVEGTIDETPTPYEGALEQRTPSSKKERAAQFFYDMDASMEDSGSKRGRKGEGSERTKRPRPTFDQEKCWFCLSSPKVEKHMVVSVGKAAYVALAKGALVEDHVLILPIAHYQSIAEAPDSVVEEIEKFKIVLRRMFLKQKRAVVFYERNYKTSHLQVQVIPVPVQSPPQLMNIFKNAAEAQQIEFTEIPIDRKLSLLAPQGTPYFYVELPLGERLFHRIRKSFSLNFGREVLASSSVLNIEDRADWQDCKISQEEETRLTKNFRKMFEPFDFTL